MTKTEPVTDLNARFSAPEAAATGWDDAVTRWRDAELYWLSTVRPDGRPHVTPLISVWLDGAAYFCTGGSERKAKNLEANGNVALTTGSAELNTGLDLVIEGAAIQVSDDAELLRIAQAYLEKYGSDWQFRVQDGKFVGDGGPALVYRVQPVTAFGFRKGEYSQTRYRFER